MTSRRSLVGSLVLLAFLLAPSLLRAQSLNASISGQITDPSGAAVPNAELALKALATGAVAKAHSGPDGFFAFPNLLAGVYDLTVSARGFRDYVQRGFSLNLNEKVRVDVKLELGAATQTIEVQANASPLNYENAEIRGAISPQTLNELPLVVSSLTRSAVNFARLLPGVTTGGGDNRNGFDVRINGGMTEGDEAVIDGVSIIDGANSQNGIALALTGHPWSPEAIAEISLLTSNYEPQYGNTNSSVITAVTKSGTNEFHGSLYEFLRNTSLNARQFGIPNKLDTNGDEIPGTARPRDYEHDFGGTIGGPLNFIPGLRRLTWTGRKKTYFFVNYEGFRLRGGTTSPIISIPSLKERVGDFTDWVDTNGNLIPIYDPATSVRDPITGQITTRQQFMGCDGATPNVICPTDPRLANSLAKEWFQFLPNPTFDRPLNNYVPPIPPVPTVNGNTTVLDVRGDHYYGDRDHFAVTVHYYGSWVPSATLLPKEIATEAPYGVNYNYINRFNWDHTFRPNLLNNLNAGYNDIWSLVRCVNKPYANVIPQIAGVSNHNNPPQIGFQDFSAFGCNQELNAARPAYIVNDLMTWVRGKHTFKFGGEIRWLQENLTSPSGESGNFNFSRLSTGLLGVNSGSSVASFLLGGVDNGGASFLTAPSWYARGKHIALYAGDTWKVTSKLSLNLGMRWDVSTPNLEKYNHLAFFDPLGANPGADNRLGRLAFSGTGQGAASFGRRVPEETYYKGFGPRVGIAYSLSPKTVVRAGYGIFVHQLLYPNWSSGVSGGQEGFNKTVAFASSDGGLTPAFLLQDGLPQNFARPPFIDSTYSNGQNMSMYRPFDAGRPAYAQQWNLTVEHQFTDNFYITAAYVANVGTRLLSTVAPLNALNPQLLSMGQQLYDQFQPGQTVLDGVPIPYNGWVQQMTGCAPTVAQALLPYPQYCNGIQGLNENAGSSTFHSFQVKAEKRFSHGIWMLTSYTLSKSITSADDVITGANTWSGETASISPFERQRNKALSRGDVPNTLSVSFIYQLPVGKGQRFLNKGGVADKVLGGWQVTSLFRGQSGIPFFFRSSQCNVPGQFRVWCIPGVLPGANPFAQAMDGNFDPNKPLFNKAAFEQPDSFNFYYGQGPRMSNLRGFPYYGHDVTLAKSMQITERIKFQLRAEFFNVWNWHTLSAGATWGTPYAFSTDLASPNFGSWTGAVTAPRNIQLGAKIIF